MAVIALERVCLPEPLRQDAPFQSDPCGRQNRLPAPCISSFSPCPKMLGLKLPWRGQGKEPRGVYAPDHGPEQRNLPMRLGPPEASLTQLHPARRKDGGMAPLQSNKAGAGNPGWRLLPGAVLPGGPGGAGCGALLLGEDSWEFPPARCVPCARDGKLRPAPPQGANPGESCGVPAVRQSSARLCPTAGKESSSKRGCKNVVGQSRAREA